MKDANPRPGQYPNNFGYPDPWPKGFGSALNVQHHSSTVIDTDYGTWDMHCITCHNPHLQEQDLRFGTTYGKLIKEYICFDNFVTGLNIEELVELTAPNGPGSFADGPPHNENVCEMCHTQTNHHRRTGDAPGDLNLDGSYKGHFDEQKCTDCHLHDAGFAPVAGEAQSPHNTQFFNSNCDFCHVVSPDGVFNFSAKIPEENCQRCHGERDSHTDDPARNEFLSGKNYVYDVTCVDCHNPMFAESTGNNRKLLREQMDLSVIGSVVQNTTRIGLGSLADGPPHNENVCETCHSLTDHSRYDGAGGNIHDDGADRVEEYCMLCHDHNRSFMVPGPSAEP
jgi:hypothetical protein